MDRDAQEGFRRVETKSPGTEPRRNAVIAGLVLLAVLVLFFNTALLPGRVLSPADAIFETPLYADLAPDGYEHPSNPLLFDQVYQFTPWRHFAWETLRAGELPLWNPHSLSGTPLVATMQAAVFYPVNLLLVAVPFESTFVLSALIRLWIAGFFTYLLARRYRLGTPAALIAGISFMLSAFLVSWLGHPHTNVAVWLPALLLAADKLAMANGRREAVQAAALLALVVGVQFTGGHIETSADILFGAGLYFVLRWGARTASQVRGYAAPLRPAIERLLALPLAYLLGAGVAAVQLLPFLEWLPLSVEYQRRSQAGFQLFDPVFVKNLLSLPVAAFPNVYNNPTWQFPYWSFNPWGNFNESALYIGTIPLILAAVALLTRWRDSTPVRIWSIVAAVTLGMALQLPVLDWINQIPGRDLAHPNRLRLITTFGLSILAGFGAQALWSEDAARRWFKRGSLTIAAIGGVLLAGGGLILPRIEDRTVDWVQRRLDLAATDGEQPRTFDLCRPRVEECVADVIAAFSPGNIEMYAPALVALAGLLALAFWSRGRLRLLPFQAAIVALVVIDLVSFGQGYNPTVASEHFYPEPAVLARIELEETTERFTVLQQAMYPDAHMMYGLSDIRGLDFPTQWYDQYLSAAEGRIPWLANGVLLSSVDSPLLTNLNLRYVVTTDPADIEENDALRLVYQEGDHYLAELDTVQPRARMTYEPPVVADDAAALVALRENPALVHQRIILPGEDAEAAEQVQPEGSVARASSNVSLQSYRAQSSRWTVTTSEPGFLLLSDAYYPGWEVYVDGESAQLLRANVAFRAVPVPSGAHQIEFRYEPGSVTAGALVSLLSLAVVATILIWTGRPVGR